MYTMTRRDYEHAIRMFQQAINVDAKFALAYAGIADAYYYYGLACSSNSDFETAEKMFQKAVEVNPADYQAPMFLAQAYTSLGRKHDEMRVRLGALETIQRHLEMNPHDTRALYFGAQNLCLIGENEKGVELAERALGQDQDEPVVLYNVACFYALQGDIDRAIELLTTAIANGWGDREWLETDSDLDTLRQDSRFKALLAQIE